MKNAIEQKYYHLCGKDNSVFYILRNGIPVKNFGVSLEIFSEPLLVRTRIFGARINDNIIGGQNKNIEMKITFINPIIHVNRSCIWAFIEILNLIIVAKNIVELNSWLIEFDKHDHFYGRLSESFVWKFDDYVFTLYQRTDYRSLDYFPDVILQIPFMDIIYKDSSEFGFNPN